MTKFDADPWIEKHSPIAAEKLHALGYLTFAWNSVEYWSHATFSVVLGINEQISRAITHDLGDVTIWEKIRLLANKRALPSDEVDLIDAAARLHDRNRINRNQYVHAKARFANDRPGLSLARLKGPDQFALEPIADGLARRRRHQ